MTPHPADSRRWSILPWFVCGLGALFFGYGYFLRVAPSVMIEELMRDFAVTAAAIGNLAAAYFYVYAGLQIPVGLAVDNTGPRRILIVAAIICAAGTGLFALADDIGLAFLARVLIGVGSAAAWVSTLKLATQWLPAERYALMVGLTNMIAMLCAVAGQGPLALFIEAVGWRTAMTWLALVGLAIAAAIWITRWAGRPPYAGRGKEPEAGVLHALHLVLTSGRAWAIALFTSLAIGPILAFAVLWGVPYLMEQYGTSKSIAGTLASMVLLGWGLGGPAVSWLSERLQRRKPVLISAPLAGIAIWAILLLQPNLPLPALYALLLFNGLTTAGVLVAFTVAKEFNPLAVSGTMTSLINGTAMLFIAGFQIVIGLLLDLTWSGRMAGGVRVYDAEAYRLAFAAIPVSLALSIVLLRFVPETYCRQLVR